MLQLITDAVTPTDVYIQAAQAMVGGCRWVQIRMKDAPDAGVLEAARLIAPHMHALGGTLLADDRVELVAANRDLFDGVHVGKSDMPPAEARRMLGPDAIIGATVNTLADILALAPWRDVSYLGMGPYRFTVTKRALAPVLGVEGYGTALAEARRHGFDLPVVAIGGIQPEDVALLATTGICGVAVAGAITHAGDPEAATARFVEAIDRYIIRN